MNDSEQSVLQNLVALGLSDSEIEARMNELRAIEPGQSLQLVLPDRRRVTIEKDENGYKVTDSESTLSPYHQRYAGKSEQGIRERVTRKGQELDYIFQELGRIPQHDGPAEVAVLGCADLRYLPHHQEMFESRLWTPTDVTTYDLTTEHLRDGNNVVQHDCTAPLPDPPYDITYGHHVPQFIPTERQGLLFINSYEALRENGLAIFLMNNTDDQPDPLRPDHYPVPFDRWRSLLAERKVPLNELTISPKRIAWVMKKTI